MVFISATRLRLRSAWYLIPFFLHNERAAKALVKTPGLLEGKELIDKGLTFWTLTMWEEGTDMKAFRNGEAHRRALRKFPEWCNEGSYVHWVQEEAHMPTWEEAYERMVAEGSRTKVRHPSADHLAGRYQKMQRTNSERRFAISSQTQ